MDNAPLGSDDQYAKKTPFSERAREEIERVMRTNMAEGRDVFDGLSIDDSFVDPRLDDFLAKRGMTYEQFESMEAPDMEALDKTLLQRRYDEEGRVFVKDVIRVEGKRISQGKIRAQERAEARRGAYIRAGDPAMRTAFESQQHVYMGGESGCIGCAA